jgi:multiple sugar transport system permease protein
MSLAPAPAPAPAQSSSTWWSRRQAKATPVLLMLPAAVVFVVYVISPIAQSLWISLHDWDGLGPKTFVGLGNYRELLRDPVFAVALKNNIKWLLLFMLAPPAGLLSALFLNQRGLGMRLVKSLFFFPFVLSQVVVGLVFSWFYDPNFGLLNLGLRALGASATSPLSSEHGVTYAIIAAGLWPQIAYCMILYLTGLNNVNPELIDAARIEGATGWQTLWHIVLPELRPASFMAVVVTVIGALRSFDLVAIMTSGGPYNSSSVLAYFMYEQSIFAYRMGYGASIATVLFVIMDAFIAFFLYSMLKKEAR